MLGRRTLIGLALAAGAMTAATVAVYTTRPGPAAVRVGEPVLPGLAPRLNDVAGVTLRTAQGSFTLTRTGEGWGLADRGGYPAKLETVRGALLGLAELRLEGARTADPALYARINVQDVTEPDAASLLIETRDAAGNPLGALIIGKERPGGFGGGTGAAHYVRRPGEAQSWLAVGALTIPRTAVDWLDKRLMTIASSRIREVAITGPDRPPLIIRREDPAATDFAVVDLPADRRVERAFRVNNVATVLEALDLTDVRPAAGLGFATDGPSATFTTYDGLAVTARLAPDPADAAARWVGFTVATVAPAGGGEPGEAIAAEARDLTARLDGWAYRLPQFKLDRMATRLEDITAPVTPAPSG